MAKELERISRVVGKEGKIMQRATMPMAGGVVGKHDRVGQHIG